MFPYEYLAPGVVIASIAAYLLLHFHMRTGFGPLHRFYPYSFGVFLLHPLLLYPVRNAMGLPDTVPGVVLHAVIMPIAYALVCAAFTWLAVKIPGLRAVFGEGGPRNPHPRPSTPMTPVAPDSPDPARRRPADSDLGSDDTAAGREPTP